MHSNIETKTSLERIKKILHPKPTPPAMEYASDLLIIFKQIKPKYLSSREGLHKSRRDVLISGGEAQRI
jgi:hypothetical protein